MPEQVRIKKQVAIARSGVQLYTRQEVRAMGITIPKGFEDKKLLGVYRPSALLAAKKDLFASQPFINTHKGFVNPENFPKWAQGWVGDSIEVELNADKTEAVLKGDLSILGAEAIEAFEDGVRQVSPHYFGTYDWEPGVAPDGTEYQVICKDITMVNHLALVPRGRGGPDAAIQDAAPGPFSAIWAFITGKKKGVSDQATFRQVLEEIAKIRDVITAEGMELKTEELYQCIRKIPMSEDVDLLYRYLGDAHLLTEGRSDEEAAEYVKIVADLYEQLEERSLQEIMNAQKKEIKGQEDSMADKVDEKAKEPDADPDKDRDQGPAKDNEASTKELEGFMAKVKDHIAGGGKVSDFELKGKKAEDEAPEEKKPEEKEKGEKDEEEDPKEKKEEKKEAEAKDEAPSILGIYDGAPFNTSMDFRPRAAQSDAGNNLLRQAGYLPKEKK